jgi:hypothetical protein
VRGFLPGTAGALSSTCRVDRILLVGVWIWVGEWGGGWQMDSGFGMEDCGEDICGIVHARDVVELRLCVQVTCSFFCMSVQFKVISTSATGLPCHRSGTV